MKRITLLTALLLSGIVFSQTKNDSISKDNIENTSQRLLSNNLNKSLTIGGYGEATFNLPEGENGELDVQRLVLLFGYNFNDKVQFI